MSNIIIHHRSKHHAKNSGYGMLVDHLTSEKLLHHKSKFPYRIAKWIAGFITNKYGNYDSASFIKDYELCKKLLKENNGGIVHYLNGERDIRFGIQLNRFKKKYKFIATFHKPPEYLKKKFNPAVFKKLDAAIAVGENQVNFLKKWLNTENVLYIPHGIECSFFKPNKEIKENCTILFVGQHLRDFEAFNFAIPKMKKLVPDLKVSVILREDFAKQIVPNECISIYSGLNDTELRTFYQKSTLLFLPLKDSTACNSILEAMACGLPIVSTDVGGNREYVGEKCGILVPYLNYELLVDETVALLHNPKRIVLLGNNARTKALDYDWSKISNKIESFYRSLNR